MIDYLIISVNNSAQFSNNIECKLLVEEKMVSCDGPFFS